MHSSAAAEKGDEGMALKIRTKAEDIPDGGEPLKLRFGGEGAVEDFWAAVAVAPHLSSQVAGRRRAHRHTPSFPHTFQKAGLILEKIKILLPATDPFPPGIHNTYQKLHHLSRIVRQILYPERRPFADNEGEGISLWEKTERLDDHPLFLLPA